MFRIVAIATATLALAYAAWTNSAVTLASKFTPQQGLRLSPNSAVALTNITEQAGAKKDKISFRKIARYNAVTALRSEPLSPRALRQLGQYYALSGETGRARKLIRLSASLSRRDAMGQLWLADDYLRHGRHLDALKTIDIIIRTQPESSEAVYTVLGGALADPVFRNIFVSYVRSKPSWLKNFIRFNINSPQPHILSQTLVRMQPLSSDIFDEPMATALLTTLVNHSPAEEARALYKTLPGADSRLLFSLAFAQPTQAFRYPPVGWELVDDASIQGFGRIEGKDVVIEGLALPGRRGTVARKLLFLNPGSYRWSGNANLDSMGGGSVTVSLLCNSGPGRWTVSGSTEIKSGRNNADWTIGKICSAQLLTIDVAGADSQVDSSMTLSNMQLSMTGAAATDKGQPAR